jgi:hypothetical protein
MAIKSPLDHTHRFAATVIPLLDVRTQAVGGSVVATVLLAYNVVALAGVDVGLVFDHAHGCGVVW